MGNEEKNNTTAAYEEPALGAAAQMKESIDEYLPNWGRPWYKVGHLLRLNLLLYIPMLSCTTNGYDGSMLNGLQSLPSWQSYFGAPAGAVLGALSNGTTFGAVIAFPFAAWISDKIGRKRSIMIGAAICVLGAALQAGSVDYAMFMVSRMIIGFGSFLSVVSSPTLVSELAYPTHRGAVTAVYNTQWYLGALVAAWCTFGTYLHMAGDWSWRLPSLVQGVMPLMQCFLTWLVPESPRWLISKGRHAEARAVLLKWHAGDDEAVGGRLVDFEMAEIITAIEHEKIQNSTRYRDFLATPANRHRLAIITLLPITMQLCGNGLVSYYLHLILNSIGITSAEEQLVINGGLMVYNLGTSVIFALIASRMPRRWGFLGGVGAMCIVFTIWTVLSAINQQTNFEHKSLGQGVLAMIFLFYACYNLALNGLPFLYFTEVLPFSLRAKGISYVNLVTQVVLIYNGFVNPVAMANMAPSNYRYYIVFNVLIAAEWIGIFFLFPETKNYTLEEVAIVFGDATEVNLPTILEEKARDREAEFVEVV